MKYTKRHTVLSLCLAIGVVSGCGMEPTDSARTSNEGGDVQLSDNVVQLLRENNTMTAAVKTHHEETGLSLSEAKKQVEEVMERDGITLGENR